MDPINDGFETERARFDSLRAGWVEAGHGGKWMVVHGAEAIGPFSSFTEAWDAGFSRFKSPHLFIDRAELEDRPVLISWMR